jgi:hypothetical protein
MTAMAGKTAMGRRRHYWYRRHDRRYRRHVLL